MNKKNFTTNPNSSMTKNVISFPWSRDLPVQKLILQYRDNLSYFKDCVLCINTHKKRKFLLLRLRIKSKHVNLMKAVGHHVVFLFVNKTALVKVILKWTCVGDIDRRLDDLSGRHPQMTWIVSSWYWCFCLLTWLVNFKGSFFAVLATWAWFSFSQAVVLRGVVFTFLLLWGGVGNYILLGVKKRNRCSFSVKPNKRKS